MKRLAPIFAALVALVVLAAPAFAVKVADITRIDGQRTNVLTGLGLVVGLKGTGDGSDFKAAMNPLAALLEKFADPVQMKDLANAQNVAVVMLSAKLPGNGGHNGDKIDVFVASIGAATSLKGGRLFASPLYGPLGPDNTRPDKMLLGLASGAISIEDPSTPTVGIVKGGAVLERELGINDFNASQFTLVIEAPAATWTTASTIAQIINDAEGADGETLAVAKNANTVVVTIPARERERPDAFISRVQRLPVPTMPTEARVQINARTGDLILTGDVEISPCVISHKGLTITTVSPTPVATPQNPRITSKNVVALDTTNQGGAKLQDLVNALDLLRVPAEDRIQIIQELYNTGKLHAKVTYEGVD